MKKGLTVLFVVVLMIFGASSVWAFGNSEKATSLQDTQLKTVEATTESEMPELPEGVTEGELPPALPEGAVFGERPELPEGVTEGGLPPALPEGATFGERPELPEGANQGFGRMNRGGFGRGRR